MAESENYPFPSGPRGRPSAQYAERREHSPMGTVRMPSGDTAILLTRYEDIAAVLADPRFSRDLTRPGSPRMFDGFNLAEAPGGLISTDPPEHTRRRRLLSGTFTPRQVTAWRPRLHALTEELIDDLPAEFDFVDELAFPLPIQIICDVMGIPGIDNRRVRAWTTQMLSTSSLTEEEKLEASADFSKYAAGLVAEHRDAPGEGLLATMIEAHDHGDRLTRGEVVRLTMGMLVGGHETTGSVLSRSILRLLDPRDGYETLVDQPGLINDAVEELLRLELPGEGGLLRVATEDVELPSGVVAKGEGVIAAFSAANRDPSVFPDPDSVVPGRDRPHLTFGRGAHFCLGANLARMELQVILGVLVERLPGLRLAEPAEDIPWSEGNMIRRPTRIRVAKSS